VLENTKNTTIHLKQKYAVLKESTTLFDRSGVFVIMENRRKNA